MDGGNNNVENWIGIFYNDHQRPIERGYSAIW